MKTPVNLEIKSMDKYNGRLTEERNYGMYGINEGRSPPIFLSRDTSQKPENYITPTPDLSRDFSKIFLKIFFPKRLTCSSNGAIIKLQIKKREVNKNETFKLLYHKLRF